MSKLGALSQLANLVRSNLNPEGARPVGEAMLKLADEPDTFVAGRAYAPDRAGLEKQFGVKFGNNDYSEKRGATIYGLTDSGEWGKPASRKELSWDEVLTSADMHEAVRPYAGSLSPRNRHFGIDTVGLDQGSGMGKRLYPALYGDILNEGGDARNLVQGLSGPNIARYLQNRSNALMRDPRAAKQLMVAPQVIAPTGLNPKEFMRLSREEQLGLMQQVGVLNLLNAVGNQQRRLGGKKGMAEMYVEKLEDIPGALTTATEQSSLRDLTNWFRGTGRLGVDPDYVMRPLDPDLYGLGSFRKAGITLDALRRQPLREGSGRGLEFKQGGRIGALSSTCACGG